MRRRVLQLVMIFCLSIVLISCDVTEDENVVNDIEVVNVTINNESYEGTVDELLSIVIETDYKIVTVTISIIDETQLFDELVKLYINDNEIIDFILNDSLQMITYKYDDPNWSGIY